MQVLRLSDTDLAPPPVTDTAWSPPLPPAHVVPRQRLHALVEDGMRRPLTSVVAPAGTGKTTLGTSIAAAERMAGRQVRWLSADHHADLGTVLLGASRPHGVPSARHGDTQVADVAELLRTPVAQPHRDPQLVVVDDAHLLRQRELQLLRSALSECPTALRVVLLSRRDPGLASVRLDLDDAITVVRGGQLMFSAAEARQLVLAHAPGSSHTEVDSVVRTSEGWAAALVMGARALAGSDDRSQHRLRVKYVEQPVLDYLLGDCFETMSESERDVLLACCQEDDVDAESALALSGVADALSHLSALADDGLVSSTVDESRAGGLVWRFHPLLKEALRRRTSPRAQEWSVVVDAHVRAAHHYSAEEDAVRALRHAHRSGDGPTVTDMLVKYGALLVPSEAATEVFAGLLCLPDPIKASAPHLLALEALLHRARGRVDVALTKAREACDAGAPIDAYAGARETLSPVEAATVVSVRLWRSMLGWDDVGTAIDHARRLLRCATPDAGHTHPHGDLSLAQSACVMVELAAAETWCGDLASAAAHLREAERAAHVLSSTQLLASALAHRCMLELAAGAYGTAADTAAAALAADPTEALPPDVRMRAELALAWAAHYALNTRAARAALKRFDDRAAPVDPLVTALLDLLRCRVLNQDGECDQAIRLLAASRVLDGSPSFLLRLAAVTEAETIARSQSLGALPDAAIRLRSLGFEEEAELFECVAPESPAAVAAAIRRLGALLARPSLHPATAAGAAAVRMSMVLKLDPAKARDLLPDLLGRVHPQRLLIFLDIVSRVSPEFLHLLMHDVEAGPSHHAVTEALVLLRRTHRVPDFDPFAETPAPPGSTTVSATDHATVEGPRDEPVIAERTVEARVGPAVVLTQRQADVLTHLALGGSYADVARSLFVTENTVKTHLNSLYQKLEVNRRADAVRRARELGLI